MDATQEDTTQERSEAETHFRSLKQLFDALSERAMRRELMAERMLAMTPPVQTELLRLICLYSPTEPTVAQMLLAFQDQPNARHQLSYQHVRDIYECARNRHYHNVQRLFLSFRPQREEQSEDEQTKRLHPQMEGVTLGERKFLARKLDIHMLEKLLSDPEPSVIRNLLRNPRLTEKEVLHIATKRPNSSEILEEIASSPRWFARFRVKSALAQNPYTPFPIALQALPFLNSEILKQIADSNQLHPQITATAQEYLRLRSLPQSSTT
jgi:arsenate reductase-like glutaredoxin family protein